MKKPGADSEGQTPAPDADLRRRAEEQYEARPEAAAPLEAAALLHELGVHQIELEMQNEELRRAQLEQEEQRAKYFELFDLAPMGYLALDEGGIVHDANLTAAHLLGVERRDFVGRPFSAFVLAADRDVYYLHQRSLRETGWPQSCELRLQSVDAEPFWAYLEWPRLAVGGEPLLYHLTFTDVHERVLAQEALRLSAEQLDRAVEGSGVGLWEWNVQTGEAVFNERWAEIVGYTLAELAPLSIDTWTGLCDPDDLQRSDELLEQHFSGQSPLYECEARMRHKDGHWVWVLDRGKVSQRDGDGRPLMMTGTHLDVGERKRAEGALRESEANFRAFFDAVDDIIVVATPDGRLVYANPAASTRLGYSAGELTALQVLDLHPPDKRGEAEAIFAAMLKGERESCSLPLQTKSGALVSVETRVWSGKWNGADCIFGVSKDLTAEQEALQQFERLFNGNPALMAVSSLPGGRFTDVNEAYLSTLGYTREEILGHTTEDLGLFAQLEQQREIVQQLLTQGSVADFELEVTCKDGTVLDGLFNAEIIESQGRQYALTVMIDQTERKQAERALEESEALYRSILDASPDGVTVTDLEGRVRMVSPAALTLFGNERDEDVVGRSPFEFLVPEDRERAQADLALTLQGAYPGPSEYRGLRADGSTFSVEVRGRFIRDADERPTGLAFIASDVSERKRVADVLRESEEKYRLLIERSQDIVFTLTADGVFTFVSPAWTAILGHPASEVVGQPRERFVHPDDASACMAFMQRMAEPGQGREVVEYRMRHLDGSWRWHASSAGSSRDEAGTVVGFEGTARDITDRRQAEDALRESEETLRANIENSFDVIFTLNEGGVFLFASAAWERHFGYPVSDVLQKSFVPFVHPDDVAPLADHLKRVLSAGESETSPAYRVKHADGGWRWLVSNGTPYVDPKGARLYIGVGRDITERKQAEEALQQAIDRLSLATRAGGVGVWDYDPVNDTLTWDEQMFALYGITREQFSGAYEAWQAGLHPGDRERGDAEIQAAMRGEQEFDTEFRVLWPDGTVRTLRALALVQHDASGRATHVIGTNWDITESRLAEDALQESEALYRSIMSASPENITITDLEGRIRLTSSAALGMFGYQSPDEAQGRLLIEFLVPEDRERAGGSVALMHQGAAASASEYRGLRADGSTFNLEVSGELMRDAQENPTGMVFISRDISERKRAEEHLRSTTALLSGLLTSLPDLVFFKDRRGVYLGCNPEFARLVGRDAEAVVGATDRDLFGEKTAELFRAQDAIMLAQGEPRHNDEWVEYPDGARALVDTLTAPLRDTDGCVIGLLGVSRDITAREEAEQRLRESEEQLARAVEGSGAGLWDWNIRKREVTFNERWAEISGHTLAELSPVSVDDWNAMWHPDDLRRSDALIERHFAGETPMYECEVRVRHEDGRWVWVLDRGKVSEWDDAGRPVRMVGTQLDVTARREAEDAVRERESYLSAIIENQPGLVWLKDTEGRFLAVNNAFAAVAGRGDAEEVVGMTDLDIWPRERAGRYLRDDVTTMETRQPTVYQQALDVDGEMRWMETFKAPVVDEDGRVLGTTGYAVDITDRKLADERLRSANRQLEQAVAHANDLAVEAQAATTAKTRFLAHMSHEIRTPLNAIIGFAQLLQHDADLTAQQADRVTIINRSGEHLLALLSDILELSKVEAKVQRLDRASFNLRELLEDLVLVFGVRAEAKGLTFGAEGLDQVPRFATGDQLKLRQTLTNLLANAVKFTDAGGVVLRVSASPEGGGVRLVALVEDSGMGIAAEEMDALFAPFEQTASGRVSGSGTGLGLAISRQFAQIMGGDLSVVSVVAEGSIFRLEVPLEAGTAEMAAKTAARRVVRLEPQQSPCTVLVVDDDADSRVLLLNMLGDAGFDVFAAGGGREAVEAFASRRPSLVLMDLWMPDVDGNEAIRRIRAAEGGAEAQIIALTANATDGVRSSALTAGADAFVAKPFRAPDLFEQIRLLTGVRYVYAESAEADASAVESPPALTREMMNSLPAELREQIREAAVRARHGRLLKLTEQVAAVDPEIGEELRKSVATFDYATVLGVLEQEPS